MSPSLHRLSEEMAHGLQGVQLLKDIPGHADRFIAAAGFGMLSMGVVRPSSRPRSRKPVEFLVSSFPEEWSKHYNAERCVEYDPVVRRLTAGPDVALEWTPENLYRSDDAVALDFMGKAREHGITTGFSLSRTTPDGTTFGMTIASPELFPVHAEVAAFLTDIGDQMLTRARRIVTRRELYGLSTREAEILLWIGQGETDRQIGERLGVSARMAMKHISGVIAKLDANNRTHAVAKAVRLKII